MIIFCLSHSTNEAILVNKVINVFVLLIKFPLHIFFVYLIFCFILYYCILGERVRNRDRVLQIHDLYKANKSSLASLLTADEEDGFEEEEHQGK